MSASSTPFTCFRFSACAGSTTTQDRLLARDYRETAVLPSSNQERVGILVLRFSKFNSPAHRCPCLRFGRHLAVSPARLRAKMESLFLSCGTLSRWLGIRHFLGHHSEMH